MWQSGAEQFFARQGGVSTGVVGVMGTTVEVTGGSSSSS